MVFLMHTSKIKTLMIYRLLEIYSDEEHPLTTSDIIALLDERGIKCERKSIYNDIAALKEVGCDIITLKGARRGFFMANRKFELPEVMLLIDAVTSAGFITPKKTKSLVEKLRSLVSDNQAKSMTSQVYVGSENKCTNEEIYIIIDSLHGAIMQKRKVKFSYRRRNIDVENKKKYTEKIFVVSPYALIWKNDHYYLVCNNEKYNNLMNLRIDRMKKLQLLDAPARPVSEVSRYKRKFDAQDYSSKMFNMFSGEECDLTLNCKLHLQEEMMDRFGASIPLTAVDSSHFQTTVKAALSDGLVSWIMQYGADIKVVEPEILADMVVKKAQSISAVYKN